MPDINAEINKKQQQNLKKSSKRYPDTQLCKCSKKKQCPLNAQCLTESIIYQTNNTAFLAISYIVSGVTAITFKVCYGNHKNWNYQKRIGW